MHVIVDALEPGLVTSRSVTLGPDAMNLSAWLRDPSDATLAEGALVDLSRSYGIELERDDRGRVELPVDWAKTGAAEIATIGLAIVAEGGSVRAVGSYWATPVFERIRLHALERPIVVERTRDVPQRLGPLVSTCAVDVDEWIVIDETMARDLLAAADEIWMLAFGPGEGQSSEPWATWLPSGQIESGLRFDHPGIPATATDYSAVFYGRGPSLAWALRNAPRVSTTLGPGDLIGWLRSLFLR